eukprot:TRINITY_DN7602_c0_g1_i3.p1 TRINITY_DN7602_c0_g1~~TRINITY_DN7602_c0_g1_i3.p1  ORF type:complete len:334 (+),score=74.67 TRINITY_DN7602_c0_g1_i3:854-1855(+)
MKMMKKFVVGIDGINGGDQRNTGIVPIGFHRDQMRNQESSGINAEYGRGDKKNLMLNKSLGSGVWIEPQLVDREADSGVYCLCRSRDDGSFMILCESCEEWYHGKCVGVRERDGKFIDLYICPICTQTGKGETKWHSEPRKRLSPEVKGGHPKRQKMLSSDRQSLEEQKKYKEQIKPKESITTIKRPQEVQMSGGDIPKLESRPLDEYKPVEQLKILLEDGLAHDVKNNLISYELLPSLRNTQELVTDIENSLLKFYDANSKEYVIFYRELLQYLKVLKLSSLLRFRIFTGELMGEDLVQTVYHHLVPKPILDQVNTNGKSNGAHLSLSKEDP